MLDLIHFSLPLRLSGSIQISYVSLFLNFTAVKKYNCNDHGDTMEGWGTEWRDIRTGTGDLIKKNEKNIAGRQLVIMKKLNTKEQRDRGSWMKMTQKRMADD